MDENTYEKRLDELLERHRATNYDLKFDLMELFRDFLDKNCIGFEE